MRLPLLAVAVTAVTLAIGAAPAAAQPACGDTITANTTLTADLNCRDVGGNALIIGADGVTLNLAGHTISDTAPAVVVSGRNGVVIRNGTIGGTTAAVAMKNVTGSTVRDVTITGDVLGLVLDGSDGNRVVNDKFPSTVLSVYNGSDHNVIRGNLLWRREGVINVNGSTYNRIVDNVVWTADDYPLRMFDADHNTVRRNRFITDFNREVWLTGSDDNLFTDNLIVAFGNYRGPAAFLEGSNRNVWRRNETGGVPVGFWVAGGDDNVFASNVVKGAIVATSTVEGADGIHVANAAARTVIRNNTVGGFADDGIEAQGYRTLIEGNSANDDGDLGIFAVSGSIDGGANTAAGNGNPLQCVGVVCG